jgi:peptidoglycan LD-endopeptidase LytH
MYFGGVGSRRATRTSRRRRVGLGVAMALVVALVAVPVSAELTPGLEEARQRAASTAEELAQAEHRLHELDQELAAAEVRAVELRAEVSALEAELGDVAVARFVRSGTTPNVLQSEDWIRQVRGVALGRSATEPSGDVLEQYAIAWSDLEAAEAELSARRAEQEQALAELRATSDELAAELARLEEQDRQAREERDRQAREALALGGGGTLRGAGASPGAAPQPAAPGRLAVCPVAGPHTFIDSWGFARSGGRAHKGVDMMASIGVPVVAPVSGSVTHRSNRIGGLSFHLDGDDGNYYYGTHLSRYGASGRVQAGDVIGFVGDTGNARGMPHLHFEVHPGGRGAVNPYPYVAAVC